jgi:hypothetical protein
MTEIHHVAVSNRAGSQELLLATKDGYRALYAVDTSGIVSSQQVEVPLVTLDGVIPESKGESDQGRC